MKNSTPVGVIATWFAGLIDRIDQFAFRESDLRAVARGWQVRRDRPFSRIYRDPRWDDVVRCPSCGEVGVKGPAEDCCPDCGGAGTVWCPPDVQESVR